MTILSKNAKYLETKVESQYGTEYHVDRISESLIAQWQVGKIFVLIVIINPVLKLNITYTLEFLSSSPLLKSRLELDLNFLMYNNSYQHNDHHYY